MNALRAKLRSTAGFSLAEQLISMIFIGLLCVVVAAGIGAALAAQGNMSSVSEANQMLSRTLEEVSDELAFSVAVDADATTYESASAKALVTLGNSDQGIVMTEAGAGGATRLMVPGTATLTPQFASAPLYDPQSNTWSYAIIIKKGDEVIASQEMKVARNTGAAQ